MGQYTSTFSSTTDSNLELENRQLRKAIIEFRDKTFEYIAKQKLQDEKYKQELAKIEEMFKNPKPYEYTNPVEAEFERPILKNPEIMRKELRKFAEFITGNMDAILASPEITNDGDETMFAQLVNSAGFECARAEVAKTDSTGLGSNSSGTLGPKHS